MALGWKADSSSCIGHSLRVSKNKRLASDIEWVLLQVSLEVNAVRLCRQHMTQANSGEQTFWWISHRIED